MVMSLPRDLFLCPTRKQIWLSIYLHSWINKTLPVTTSMNYEAAPWSSRADQIQLARGRMTPRVHLQPRISPALFISVSTGHPDPYTDDYSEDSFDDDIVALQSFKCEPFESRKFSPDNVGQFPIPSTLCDVHPRS